MDLGPEKTCHTSENKNKKHEQQGLLPLDTGHRKEKEEKARERRRKPQLPKESPHGHQELPPCTMRLHRPDRAFGSLPRCPPLPATSPCYTSLHLLLVSNLMLGNPLNAGGRMTWEWHPLCLLAIIEAGSWVGGKSDGRALAAAACQAEPGWLSGGS